MTRAASPPTTTSRICLAHRPTSQASVRAPTAREKPSRRKLQLNAASQGLQGEQDQDRDGVVADVGVKASGNSFQWNWIQMIQSRTVVKGILKARNPTLISNSTPLGSAVAARSTCRRLKTCLSGELKQFEDRAGLGGTLRLVARESCPNLIRKS